MAKTKAPRRKHVPMRTCIVCRQTRGKRDLVRLVRTPENTVQVDPTGKAAGRGAYLCRAKVCWDAALGSNRLNGALKIILAADDKARLAEYAAALPPTLPVEEPIAGVTQA